MDYFTVENGSTVVSLEVISNGYQISVMNDRLSKKNIKKLIKYHTTKLVDMILELEDYDFLYQEEHTINILRQARKVNSLHEKEELLRMRGN